MSTSPLEDQVLHLMKVSEIVHAAGELDPDLLERLCDDPSLREFERCTIGEITALTRLVTGKPFVHANAALHELLGNLGNFFQLAENLPSGNLLGLRQSGTYCRLKASFERARALAGGALDAAKQTSGEPE